MEDRLVMAIDSFLRDKLASEKNFLSLSQSSIDSFKMVEQQTSHVIKALEDFKTEQWPSYLVGTVGEIEQSDQSNEELFVLITKVDELKFIPLM